MPLCLDRIKTKIHYVRCFSFSLHDVHAYAVRLPLNVETY